MPWARSHTGRTGSSRNCPNRCCLQVTVNSSTAPHISIKVQYSTLAGTTRGRCLPPYLPFSFDAGASFPPSPPLLDSTVSQFHNPFRRGLSDRLPRLPRFKDTHEWQHSQLQKKSSVGRCTPPGGRRNKRDRLTRLLPTLSHLQSHIPGRSLDSLLLLRHTAMLHMCVR